MTWKFMDVLFWKYWIWRFEFVEWIKVNIKTVCMSNIHAPCSYAKSKIMTLWVWQCLAHDECPWLPSHLLFHGNVLRAFQMERVLKICLPMQETLYTQVRSLGPEVPLEMEWLPIPVFLPGKSHGERNLVDYSSGSHSQVNLSTYRVVGR